MAVATSTFSSCADSALRSSSQSSPYFLPNGHQQYGMFAVQAMDAGLIRCFPPGLLPAGLIHIPSYMSPVERAGGELVQQLSTPVMHPKLVNTLKAMLSPLPLNEQYVGSKAIDRREDVMDELSQSATPATKRLKSTQERFQLPALFNASPVTHEAVPREEVDDDEAAVVPVDLIQNRRPFKCAHAGCNKTFKNPQTMKMHHKTHYSDDASYRLGGHALSSTPSTYKAGHNKKIPSRCPICKKTFVGLYELRRHFGRKHSEGEKTFVCKKCGKRFYIEVDLRDHEKLCGEPIECKCGMKFAFKCNLVAHKKGHPECQDHSPPTEDQTAAAVARVKDRSLQSTPTLASSHSSPSAAIVPVRAATLQSTPSLPSQYTSPIPLQSLSAMGTHSTHVAPAGCHFQSLPSLVSSPYSPISLQSLSSLASQYSSASSVDHAPDLDSSLQSLQNLASSQYSPAAPLQSLPSSHYASGAVQDPALSSMASLTPSQYLSAAIGHVQDSPLQSGPSLASSLAPSQYLSAAVAHIQDHPHQPVGSLESSQYLSSVAHVIDPPLQSLSSLSSHYSSNPMEPSVMQLPSLYGVCPLQEALGTSGYGVDSIIQSPDFTSFPPLDSPMSSSNTSIFRPIFMS